MIEYEINGELEVKDFREFFRGWKSRPPDKVIEGLIEGSDLIATARDNGKLVGFLTVITDGAMHAVISLVEVLPSHEDAGVRRYLVQMALSELGGLHNIALLADHKAAPFYQGLGFEETYAMHIRDYSYGPAS